MRFRVQSDMSTVVMDNAYRHGQTIADISAYIHAVAPRFSQTRGMRRHLQRPVNWLNRSFVGDFVAGYHENDVLKTELWRRWIGEYRVIMTVGPNLNRPNRGR